MSAAVQPRLPGAHFRLAAPHGQNAARFSNALAGRAGRGVAAPGGAGLPERAGKGGREGQAQQHGNGGRGGAVEKEAEIHAQHGAEHGGGAREAQHG